MKKKSAIAILTEMAAGFSDKKAYLQHLEHLTLSAFTHALCALDEQELGVSAELRADNAYSRAVALILIQGIDTANRLTDQACGREIG